MKVLILLLSLFWGYYGSKLRISEVSLLLSYNSTGHEIVAGGPNCFLWSTNNPSILEIEYPGDETCTSSVRVKPSTILDERISTMIIATDVGTGETVKCEVFIDHIFSLQLLTTVRKLILYELEVLSVQALDFSENVFSTLEGLNFGWDVDNEEIMRLLPLNTTEAKLDLSNEKYRGMNPFSSDAIIAHGTKIGATKVTTTLISDKEEPISVIVDFFVVDNFRLLPGELLFVIPNSYFTYTLVRIVNETENHLVMPYENFVWTSSNTTVATIDQLVGYFDANEDIGYTNTRVYDSDFEMNEAKGIVYVVEPVYMKIRMKQLEDLNPHHHTHPKIADDNLIYDMRYKVELLVFDKDDHQIYITDNIDFSIEIKDGRNNFNLQYREKGIFLETLEIGSFTLEATMTTEDERYLLRSRQVFHIYPKVSIDYPKHEVIHLPLDVNIRQDYYAKAIGGRGTYQWFVLDSDFIEVADMYRGIVWSNSFGRTTIVTFDRENYDNWDEREIEVSIPHSLKYLPSVREAAVGRDLCLHLAVRNSAGNAFANYTRLGVTFHVVGEKIFRFHPDGSGHDQQDCIASYDIFPFLAEIEGWARIEAKYKSFRDSVTVAAYPPFVIMSPPSVREAPIVVSLGASITLILEGGPREWKKTPRSILSNTESVEEEDIINFVSEIPRRRYFMQCLDFGRQDITFRIVNDIREAGALPTIVEMVKEFSCQPPDYLGLVPLEPSTRNEVKPLSFEPIRTYHVKNNQTVPVIMNVYTPYGDRFVNYSTLITDWWLIENPIVHLGDLLDFIPSHDERLIFLNDQVGRMKVHGEIIDYNREMVRVSGANMRSMPVVFDLIEEEIELKITSSLEINFFCGMNLEQERIQLEINRLAISSQEDKIDETDEDISSLDLQTEPVCNVITGFHCSDAPYMLFFHDLIVARGRVDGGSGTFETSINDTNIAYFYEEEKDYFTLQSLEEGVLEITAQDIHFMSVTRLLVKISDVYGVEVRGRHFVEQYHSIFLQVTPVDEDGNVFDPYQLTAMNYHLKIVKTEVEDDDDEWNEEVDEEERIINVKDCQFGRYEVFGKRVGRTAVIVSVTNRNGIRLMSHKFFVHVYTPFRLQPENELLLIPKAIYQVTTKGGPKYAKLDTKYYLSDHFVNMTYLDEEDWKYHENKEVATVNERGLVTAERVGQVKLTVEKWYGRSLIKTLKLDVIVVQLDTVMIIPGTTTIHEDRKVPLTCYGLSDDYVLSPLSLQSPHFSVKYENLDQLSISNDGQQQQQQQQQLQKNQYAINIIPGLFTESKHRYLPEHVRWSSMSYITGENEGYGNIGSTARFENHEFYGDYSFEIHTSVYVSPSLEFTKHASDRIFLPFDSRYVLRTNRYGDESLSYHLIDWSQQQTTRMISSSMNQLLNENNNENVSGGNLAEIDEEIEEEGLEEELEEEQELTLKVEEMTGLLISGQKEGAVGVLVQDLDYSFGSLLQHVFVKKPKFIDVMDFRVKRDLKLSFEQEVFYFINFKTDRGDMYVTTREYIESNIMDDLSMKITTNDHAVLDLSLETFEESDYHQLSIHGIGSGVATLEIRNDKNSDFGHYMIVVVKPKILPEGIGTKNTIRLFIGEEVTFSAIGCVQDESRSEWISSHKKVAKISSKTGFTQAKGTGSTTISYLSQVTGRSSVPVEVDKIRTILFDTHRLDFTLYVYEEGMRRRKQDVKVVGLKFQLKDSKGRVYRKRDRKNIVQGLRNEHINVILESKNPYIKVLELQDADQDGYYNATVELFTDEENDNEEYWNDNKVKFSVQIVYEEGEEGNYFVDQAMISPVEVRVRKHYMTKKAEDKKQQSRRKSEERKSSSSLMTQILVAVITIGISLFFYNFFLYRLFRN